VDDAVAAWQGALADLTALAESLDSTEWAHASRCPGWTVADVIAHTIDLESQLAGDPRPTTEPQWQALAHVRTDLQRFTEIGVDARRGRSPASLLGELRDVAARRQVQVNDADPQQSVAWFVGELPLTRLLRMRTFDIWTHEQDIRVALGHPGGLESPAAVTASALIGETLPYIWGKKVGAAATLALVVAPPGPAVTWLLAVRDGRAVVVESGDPDVRVDIGWSDLAARAAGRIPAAEVSVTITGEAHLGRRLLEELAFTP